MLSLCCHGQSLALVGMSGSDHRNKKERKEKWSITVNLSKPLKPQSRLGRQETPLGSRGPHFGFELIV